MYGLLLRRTPELGMQPLRLDDDHTIRAIGILADVLDQMAGPALLECTLASKALRQVVVTRSQPGFDFAARAFSTLSPDLRRQIADNANAAARTRRIQPPPRVEEPQHQPTSFLDALNNRGRAKPR